MKISLTVLVVLALSFCALAQQQGIVITDLHGQTSPSGAVSQGEPLLLRLNGTLDAGKARTGDAVAAEVLRSLKEDGAGTPKKSVLMGHLTQVTPFSKSHGRSTLGIVFDQIRLPDGSTRAFSGMIRALGSYPDPGFTLCYPGESENYNGCIPIPGPVELTAESVGIFNLDGSLDPGQLLQMQLVVSNRHNVKLSAGTRMVVLGKITSEPSAKVR